MSGEKLLQEKYGTTKRATSFYENQMLNYLNQNMMDFISNQSMLFVSTSDLSGNCDASFRAGGIGFVKCVDSHTLIYPEYRGNGVMASLGNILENPHIGLMFIDFFENSIGLHVNGVASIVENDQLADLDLPEQMMKTIEAEEGCKPERWVLIKVDEAYIHCSKHIPKFNRLDKEIMWGSDDERQKGGDFFKAKQSKIKDVD